MDLGVGACPTPHKKRYSTCMLAEAAGSKFGLNAYKCVCGVWHNTKRMTEKARRRERRRGKKV